MAAGEHVHSNNALCPECCRLIASPHFRAVSYLNDILYPIKGFLDDATDEIGNVLTRMMGKDPTATVAEIEEASSARSAPDDTHFGRRQSPLQEPNGPQSGPNDTVRTTTWVDQPEAHQEIKNQRDVLTTPLPREQAPAESDNQSSTDWLNYAKNNYLKIRKSQELDAAPAMASATQEALRDDDPDEEVRLRGKVAAKRAVPITPTAMMGLQFESRVQEADTPKEVLPSSHDLSDLLGPNYELAVEPTEEKPIKPRDWMGLIAQGQTDSGNLPAQPRQVPRQQVIYDGAQQYQAVPQPQAEPEVDPFPGIHSWREEVEHRSSQLTRRDDPKTGVERRQRQHNHDGRTVCEECINQMVRPGNHHWEETKENLLVLGRGALATAQVIGIGIFGAGMALASIFPNTIQPQTLEQQKAEEERRVAQKKKKNELDDEDQARWEEDRDKQYNQRRDEHKAWEDSNQALWRAKRIMHVEGEKAADDEFWKAYNHRHDQTAAEKKAWEDARTEWETEKANRNAKKKAEQDNYFDQRQNHWEEQEKEKQAWWAAKNKYEDEREARRAQQKAEDDRYAAENDNAYWNEHNKAVRDINDMGKHPIFDSDDNRAIADDQLVKEVNSLARAVEDGKEDPGKLSAATKDLSAERRSAWDREQKKGDLHNRFLDLQSRARNAEDRAAIAASRGDYDGADRAAKEADSLWRDADGAMAAYRNV
jgi:hypothetical protein